MYAIQALVLLATLSSALAVNKRSTQIFESLKRRNVEPSNNTELSTFEKRDDSPHTLVTTSDTSINFGSVGASGTYGVYHHLYDVCHEGGCEPSPVYISSHYTDGSDVYNQDVALTASGMYDGWDQRTVFIEAVLAVAAKNEQCEDKDYANVNGGGCTGCGVETGSVHMCRQTYYIQIDHWASAGYYEGGIKATTQEIENESGWCKFLDILSEAGGILGAVPGAGAIASGAEFFGTVTGKGC
ncbi:hypothetical protein QM012_008193 [Aureobasidium pullulans]|uniref:Uncharacterized protein n=1 Tax=Aureobasidium pullulans TaxID=5580 RepID=A0ABR0TJS5_AURPU